MSYRMEIVEDKDEGGIAAAMGSTMPTTANPTAQGMISVISFAKILHFSFCKSNGKSKIKRIKEFRRILYGCSKTVSVQDFFVLF